MNEPARDKAQGWGWVPLQACVIALAGWWVFAPALRGGWLWDDDGEVSQNALLRDPTGLGKIWFSRAGMDYFPLKSTVQWILWRLWGDQPGGFHLTSLILHILSALLFWRVLSMLGVRLAWLGGLFFVVHPLTVESVAWISELKNTLSLPFLLGAVIAYLRFSDGASDASSARRAYALSLFLFLLAMLSKSTVVMLPFVLLLFAWWKYGRIGRKDILSSIPFFAVSLALGLTTLWFQHNRAMPGAASVHLGGFLSRIAGAGLAVAFYSLKCVLPFGLSPVYPRWAIDPPALVQFLPWLGLAVVFGLLWMRRRSWGRPVLLGAGFFLLNLVPVLGVIPMAYQRVSWVADHFVYLPLLGLIGLGTAGIGRWYAPSRARSDAIWPIACAGVASLGLAMLSHDYAGIFHDEETLWTHTLRRNPDAWMAHSGLGRIRMEQGRLTEAAAEFRRALDLEPDSAEVQANLGDALLRMGNAAEAMAHFRQAFRIDPGFAGAYYDLGDALLQTGQPYTAAREFATAIRINPNYAAAENNLGLALARMGLLMEAVPHYERALRLRPDYPDAELNLGNAYFRLDRVTDALSCYEEALRIDPLYAAAHHNLAYALQSVGRVEEAKAQFDEAARLGTKP